jgi:putative pyruvate formate lyase activating enzyme
VRPEPIYLQALDARQLAQKAERARALLADCRMCPRDCGVDRLADRYAFCLSGRYALVSSYFPHFGEEDCLRGWNGSGTIFFGHCNLRCVFCQNFDISQRAPRKAKGHPPEAIAAMMLELQERGCHNINVVTPEHVAPQIVEALAVAIEKGLRLPIVYNTSAYDSLASLELMDGLVDIYMPDFKVWSSERARRYLKAEDYPEVARHSIRAMQAQVGDLTLDETGLARRGLLVRHLVMPGGLDETREILGFLVREISADVYLNLMDQYHPAGRVSAERYPEIDRGLHPEEWEAALELARRAGIRRLDARRPHAGLRKRLLARRG